MKKKIFLFSMILTTVLALSSCAHRDCRGHKKTVKTDMGGWL